MNKERRSFLSRRRRHSFIWPAGRCDQRHSDRKWLSFVPREFWCFRTDPVRSTESVCGTCGRIIRLQGVPAFLPLFVRAVLTRGESDGWVYQLDQSALSGWIYLNQQGGARDEGSHKDMAQVLVGGARWQDLGLGGFLFPFQKEQNQTGSRQSVLRSEHIKRGKSKLSRFEVFCVKNRFRSKWNKPSVQICVKNKTFCSTNTNLSQLLILFFISVSQNLEETQRTEKRKRLKFHSDSLCFSSFLWCQI